jgi:branched-chain amino acid transport system ATP-binding protein
MSDHGESLLSIREVDVSYGTLKAVSHVSFDVKRGATTAILGANGAGKSSLARAIAGLVPFQCGMALFGGVDITDHPAHARRRLGLAYLPEERGIFRELTVTDNLRMASRWLSSRELQRSAVDAGLELFPRLAERRGQVAGSLSGGEQQMLALAMCLSVQPLLLVADEPSIGLGPIMVDAVFEGLERATEAGMAVVVVEQFVHRALALADSAMILRNGQVVWQGLSAAVDDQVLSLYLDNPAEVSLHHG